VRDSRSSEQISRPGTNWRPHPESLAALRLGSLRSLTSEGAFSFGLGAFGAAGIFELAAVTSLQLGQAEGLLCLGDRFVELALALLHRSKTLLLERRVRLAVAEALRQLAAGVLAAGGEDDPGQQREEVRTHRAAEDAR
jgi:hypothetical protein